MGLNFRKSISILPGVKLNLSKSGVGVSVGTSGVRASINSKGRISGSVGIPGSGISYRKSTSVSKLAKAAGLNKSEENKKTKGDKKAAAAGSQKKTAAAAEKKQSAAYEKRELKKLSEEIMSIYAVGDSFIDWIAINGSESNIGMPMWSYFKERAAKVLDGDIDTYLQIVQDCNPFDDLLAFGSNFTVGTDNPMKLHVNFDVNSEKIFGDMKNDRDLVEDYIAGVAIRAARDSFALLPVWNVIVTADDGGREVLSVNFSRESFEALKFGSIDASDTIARFNGKINL